MPFSVVHLLWKLDRSPEFRMKDFESPQDRFGVDTQIRRKYSTLLPLYHVENISAPFYTDDEEFVSMNETRDQILFLKLHYIQGKFQFYYVCIYSYMR